MYLKKTKRNSESRESSQSPGNRVSIHSVSSVGSCSSGAGGVGARGDSSPSPRTSPHATMVLTSPDNSKASDDSLSKGSSKSGGDQVDFDPDELPDGSCISPQRLISTYKDTEHSAVRPAEVSTFSLSLHSFIHSFCRQSCLYYGSSCLVVVFASTETATQTAAPTYIVFYNKDRLTMLET